MVLALKTFLHRTLKHIWVNEISQHPHQQYKHKVDRCSGNIVFRTFVYFIDRNQKYYKDLKQALIDYPDYSLTYFKGAYTEDQLKRGKDTYKRWRDLSYILTVGFYALQIVDASVDAYMFNWDVSPDISLRVEPSGIYMPDNHAGAFGLRASLAF